MAPSRVDFVGYQADVTQWFAAADVVALPSRWEGMAFTLLEAMAAGCSVVATDVAGSREALGGAGAIVPVGDTTALSDAIAERLHDPEFRDAEGRAASERARTRYDLGSKLNQVAELYDDLLAVHR